MASVYSADQLLNIALGMGLAALATAASIELRAPANGTASAILEAEAALDDDDDRATVVRLAESRSLLLNDGAKYSLPLSPASVLASQRMELAEITGSAPASAAAGAARSVAPPVEAKLAALPAKAGVIFEELGRKICIGGTGCQEHCKVETDGCEVKPAYVIKLDQPAHIDAIQLYAHDQIGPSRRASLIVKVNGEPVGKTPVYRYGSTLTVKVGRPGQLVTVESMHQANGFLMGGEEAVIWDIYLIGREPR